jgi:hypothetical protein
MTKIYLGDTKGGFYIRAFWYSIFFGTVVLELYGVLTEVNSVDVLSLIIPVTLSGACFMAMGAWKRSVKG